MVYYPFHFVEKKGIRNTLGRIARSYQLYAHGICFIRGLHRKSSLLDKVGGGGLVSQKKFSALRVSVWSKHKGGPGPRVPPMDPPLPTWRLFSDGFNLVKYVIIMITIIIVIIIVI